MRFAERHPPLNRRRPRQGHRLLLLRAYRTWDARVEKEPTPKLLWPMARMVPFSKLMLSGIPAVAFSSMRVYCWNGSWLGFGLLIAKLVTLSPFLKRLTLRADGFDGPRNVAAEDSKMSGDEDSIQTGQEIYRTKRYKP